MSYPEVRYHGSIPGIFCESIFIMYVCIDDHTFYRGDLYVLYSLLPTLLNHGPVSVTVKAFDCDLWQAKVGDIRVKMVR